MKIAIAYGQGRISSVFDSARELILIDVEGTREVQRVAIAVGACDPLERVRAVLRSEADVLLCGAVSHGVETTLIGAGVQVCSFIRGELDPVIAAFLNGRLQDAAFQMPGKSRSAAESADRYPKG